MEYQCVCVLFGDKIFYNCSFKVNEIIYCICIYLGRSETESRAHTRIFLLETAQQADTKTTGK